MDYEPLGLGAQHIVSLTRASGQVERIVGADDAFSIANQDTEDWLSNECEGGTTLDQVVQNIVKAAKEKVNVQVEIPRNYSIAVEGAPSA